MSHSGEAQVYNLHLVTDNVPDYTDLDSFVQSSTATWKTPEEKSIAVWRWGRRSRRQTSCAVENGRHIFDPILHYNSYGAMNCGIISALNICSWLKLGYQARYVQLGDHTVSEVSWDEGQTWHLFDSSMSFFCYNHQGQIASCEEIKQAHGCELSGGKTEPGHYYFYHPAPQCASHLGPAAWRSASDNPVEYDRTLAKGASSYTDGFSVDKYCQNARFGHRYVLNIRPGESYTRYWKPLDSWGREQLVPELSANTPAGTNSNPDYFRPMANGSDPDAQHGLHNIRGNGLWIFEPNLADPDCDKLFYDSSGVVLSPSAPPKLHPADIARTNWVIFQISAANVITSMRIEAGARRNSSSDALRILVSRNAGIRWQQVWQSAETGPQPIRLQLREEVAGTPFCWIKVEMFAAKETSSVGLDSLKVITATQLNRRTLPALTLGSNQILLRADAQAETVELWPALHADKYQETIFQEEDVFSDKLPDGMYKATLGAAVNNKPCSVTWQLNVPTDIIDLSYNVISTVRSPRFYVSLQNSWDGSRFDEFFRLAKDNFPADHLTSRTFATADIPAGAKQAFFRAVFFCNSGAATYNMAGIQDVLIRIHHKPRANTFKPFEVAYHWTEHREQGSVERSHTELVGKLPHRYTINVAGTRDPTMNWIRINAPGYNPDGKNARYGYSDGTDPGPGCEYPKVSYHWGKAVSTGKPYTASRPSSTTSGNPDTNGRELTDGLVIAPTDYMTSKSVQTATAIWAPGEPVSFVLDLGASQSIGGVRISTHQPNARFCHPKTIEVAVSADRQSWQPMGIIRHDDLWKAPGDYEPWEHDDSPKYAHLPAGGRLAYSYPLAFPNTATARYIRFTCTPLDGKGIGLSELQAFDRVKVSPWPAEIFLPADGPSRQ